MCPRQASIEANAAADVAVLKDKIRLRRRQEKEKNKPEKKDDGEADVEGQVVKLSVTFQIFFSIQYHSFQNLSITN